MLTLSPFLQLTDHAIIERVVNGEVTLFEVLIRRYNPYLYKVGRSYGYNHHDVEDLMQETFINAYQNLVKFENRSLFKTWLIRIMLNECYRKSQRAVSRKEFTVDTTFHEKTKPMFSDMNNSDTARTVGNRELNNVIEKAINQIPLDYRLVFSLREINGLSVIETAKALNISDANVKVRLNRAKSMLKKQIEKMYAPEEIFEFNLIYCNRIVTNVMRRVQLLNGDV